MSREPLTREIPAPADLVETPARPTASCARCGRPLPPTKRGVPRRDARYCSPACRAARTREARAAAREDLAAGLALISRALRRLGLDPARPLRRPRRSPCSTYPKT